MKKLVPKTTLLLFLFCLTAFTSCAQQRLMENLDRGVVAIVKDNNSVAVSWRILGTDPENLCFNLYRKTGNAAPLLLKEGTAADPSFFTDKTVELSKENTWYVTSIHNGKEQKEPGSFTLNPNAKPQNFRSLKLHQLEGYTANDASVGDLDGDGEYEIILHMTGVGHDNSHRGLTDPPIFQAYKLDGTFLWQLSLGKNIREGAHYTQFLVYD
ncbi:MAG: rhamnogalacturonan lyase family protein, partial [Flavobacteriales bacterium]